MNIQGWFPLGLTGLISLWSKRLSRVFCSTSSKASIIQCSAFFMVQLSHPYMTTGKTIALTIGTFVSKWCLCFLIPCLFHNFWFFITFLPRSKLLLISWLQSPSAVILEPKKIKSIIVSLSTCHEVMVLVAMILLFWMSSFKPAVSLSSFTFVKRLFSCSSLSAIRVVASTYLRLLIFLPTILISPCVSSSLAFPVMNSAYALNKQGDNLQVWSTPFPIFNQYIVPFLVLTLASCRFLF